MSIKQWIQGLLWDKVRPEPDQQVMQGYLCIGGPFHNTRLRLYSPSTMPFRVGEFHGRYEGRRGSDIIKWIEEESA